jgi:hypothetical protein
MLRDAGGVLNVRNGLRDPRPVTPSLVPLLGQRRAADIVADGPGSRGPDLRPERKRCVDAHH